MRAIVIGTAGHIDHGKSALVKALTGTDPDRLKEERERGITIDLGFAHLEAGDVTLSFVDVPGHERFVRNMLAGAGGIDAVLLVVAADESVKPQTREHFEIVRLIGLDKGVVALSKADLVDRDTRELVALEVRDLVSGTFLETAPIIPVSARTGEGLPALVDALCRLDPGAPRQRRSGLVRLPIDRVFTVKGFGTVVTGTLVSGRIAEGDALEVLPAAREVRVRGLHVHGRSVRTVEAPSRAAVNLGGTDAGALARGLTLATPDSLEVTRRADLRLTLVADAAPLKHGARVRVHHGTADVVGRVAVAAVRAAGGDAWTPARPGELGVTVPGGGDAYARLRLDRPFVLTRGDRVVLRSASPAATIGGGLVLDPLPPSGGVRRRSALDRFLHLESAADAVCVWLAEAGGRGIDTRVLMRRAGLDADAAGREEAALVETGRAVSAGGRVFDRDLAASLAEAVTVALRAFHQAEPDEDGMFREALRERVAGRAALALFDAVLAGLGADGVVTGAERVALAAHRPVRSAAEERLATDVLTAFRRAGLTPPDPAALAGSLGLASPALERLLQRLVRERRLARLADVYFHPEGLEALKREVRGLGATSTIDVATFKARYALTRKFAIPLLEWLDRERVTRRVGDRRVVI